MIDRHEILDFSRELQLAPEVVEKDYVLGWLLAGIYQHAATRETWRFKGGTCLKKCFFETYRFSEDLDFTLTAPEQLDQEFLNSTFGEIAVWVYDESGIELPHDQLAFDVFTNPRGSTAAQGKVGYRGPMQPRGSAPRIKLDLTADERLVLNPVRLGTHHPYSDKPAAGIEALCYSYEELFGEKLRALAERLRPRDLYDVVHFHRHSEFIADANVVRDVLTQKCDFKRIRVPTYESLLEHTKRSELEAEWENMLAHQLAALPPINTFWEELRLVFDWLEGALPEMQLTAAPSMEVMDATWMPPAFVGAWHYSAPVEPIRFAAANRLCVELGYDGTRRLIEPYALRRSKAGNLLLIARKHFTGEVRSYRLDRIQSTRVVQTPYVPMYLVELSSSGELIAPPLTRKRS